MLASLGSGGIQGFVFSLAYEQAKKGHEVKVIITDICDNEHSYKQEKILNSCGVEVIRLNRHRGNKLELIKTTFQCRRAIGEYKPDIVNSHAGLWGLYGAISCIGKKYKQVCTIHSTRIEKSAIIDFFCKDKPTICCAKAAFDVYSGTNNQTVCIENGVAAEIVRTKYIVDLRSECKLPSNSKVIVSVGNLRAPKNYKFLVELAKLAEGTDLHFFICGASFGSAYDDPTQYEGYPNLHCLGARSDVSAIENAADLFLSSSLYEGLPIAVLEAYFNGVPCVLSPIKEHKQISDVPKVWIPQEFEPQEFMKTIKLALETKESHDEIYEMRKPAIEKFSISRTADEYLAFYSRIL